MSHRREGGWYSMESVSWIHALPIDDIAYHQLSAYCPCIPEIQKFHEGQKTALWHTAFDFREVANVIDVIEPLQFDLPIGYDAIFFTRLTQ